MFTRKFRQNYPYLRFIAVCFCALMMLSTVETITSGNKIAFTERNRLSAIPAASYADKSEKKMMDPIA